MPLHYSSQYQSTSEPLDAIATRCQASSPEANVEEKKVLHSKRVVGTQVTNDSMELVGIPPSVPHLGLSGPRFSASLWPDHPAGAPLLLKGNCD
jgi:hypothetical protein